MPISSGARFDQYYKWMRAKERAGACASFVVTRHGDLVGLMQVRLTHPGVGELGWVVSPDAWGSHVFTTAASLLCNYAYDTMGLSRLEARIAVQNTRAGRAVAKLGAVREAVLRQSLRIAGRTFDEQLWALVKMSAPRRRVTLLVPIARTRTLRKAPAEGGTQPGQDGMQMRRRAA